MAVTIINIDPNDPISNGPSEINANFSAVKQHIEELESLLSPSNNTLKLTNLTTIPANSIESEAITLTKASGNALVIAPAGGSTVATIDVDGNASVNKVVASGTGSANRSEFQDVLIDGEVELNGDLTANALLDLKATDGRIAYKSTVYTITDANVGNSATNPLDISKQAVIYLDYHNSGNSLGNNGEVKLDLTNMEEGQIIEFLCLRTNAGGSQALHNGDSGSEIFAYIDPTGSGFTTISSTTKPAFTPGSTPDNRSRLKCQWKDIGGGNFRLVVLEAENVTGVN